MKTLTDLIGRRLLVVLLMACITIVSEISLLFAQGWVDDGTVVRLQTSTDIVGMGTSLPATELHLYRDVGNPEFRIETAGVGNNPSISLKSSAFSWNIVSAASDTNKPLKFYDGISTRLAILDNGNVGIGTASPETSLDVVGPIRFQGYTKATLPAAGTTGRLARVTDDKRGVWMDNGTSFEPIYPVANAAGFSGANAGIKIQAAISSLPSTGGTVDARALEGTQTIDVNMFSGVPVTKPITLLLGYGTYSISVTQAVTASGTTILGSTPGDGVGGLIPGTTLKWTGAYGGTMFTFWGLISIRIEELQVLANNLLSTAFQFGQQAGGGNVWNIYMKNVRVPGGQGAVVSGTKAMLDLRGPSGGSVQDSLFESCAFTGGYAAVNAGISENVFNQVQFDSSTVGLLVNQSASPICVGCLFTINGTAIGIESTEQVNSIRLFAPWFEGGATNVILKKTNAGLISVTGIEMFSPKFATGNGAGNMIDLTNMDVQLQLIAPRTTPANDVNILNSANSGVVILNQSNGPDITVSGAGNYTQFTSYGVKTGMTINGATTINNTVVANASPTPGAVYTASSNTGGGTTTGMRIKNSGTALTTGARLDFEVGTDTNRWMIYTADGRSSNVSSFRIGVDNIGDYLAITRNGSVGIGTTTPNAAALLEVNSTTKGFLPPRMTTTQRNAISTPPVGLMIYNTSTNKLNFYDGTAWRVVTSN